MNTKLSGFLIEKFDNMGSAYTCHRLAQEAHNIGVDLKIIGAQDCFLTYGEVINNNKPLECRDFVINRYKWGEVKNAINTMVRRSYNNIDAFSRFVNKYQQMICLESKCFEKPTYILGNSQISFIDLQSFLGIPFVAKGLENSMGKEILLIETEDDYYQLTSNPEKEWLFERFIKSSYGRDLRLFSIRGQCVACMMRKSKGDFRANVALGASTTSVAITKTLQQIADDIWQQTKLDFVGIDLLFGETCYYFCEINVMPGLEGIESASHVNIAQKIISTICSDFYEPN